MFDRQIFFNLTVLHLHQQAAPAYDFSTNTCLYRQYLDNGICRKCAIGCHIPDNLYDKRMETRYVGWINRYDYSGELRKILLDSEMDFLANLQSCHDNAAVATKNNPENWWGICVENLKSLAEQYELSINELPLN